MRLDKKWLIILSASILTISFFTGMLLIHMNLKNLTYIQEGRAPKILGIPPSEKFAVRTAVATVATESMMTKAVSYRNRVVIRSANIHIEAGDPGNAVNRIIFIAESLGGYVESMNVLETGRRSAEIVLRVPEDVFFDALSKIRQVGRVLSEEVFGRDVTEQYVDLESRLRNLKAEEEWLLTAMDKAKNVQDLMMIEKELWRIRGEIEKIEGRLKYLERSVEYSTIRVSITPPSKPGPKPSPFPTLDLIPVLSMALTAIYYITYGLIFLAIVGSPLVFLAYLGYRIYRRLSGR